MCKEEMDMGRVLKYSNHDNKRRRKVGPIADERKMLGSKV